MVDQIDDGRPLKPNLTRDNSKEDIFGTKVLGDGDVSGNASGVEGLAKVKRIKITPIETRNKAVSAGMLSRYGGTHDDRPFVEHFF